MARPTDAAIDHFGHAILLMRNVGARRGGDEADREEARAVEAALRGLQDFARGLRATYILLEEVKGLLKGSGAARPAPGGMTMANR
jgi:hypothetical protein